MTREQVAKMIHWEWIIWGLGLVNVVAMFPQLSQLLTTHVTEGLSVWMFGLYLVIQSGFCLEGYFKRNKMFFTCMGLSALVSTSIVFLTLYYRYVA